MIRYDTYSQYKNQLRIDDTPCIVYGKIEKNHLNNTITANWHEDLEIQLFTEGEGYLLIDGQKYKVQKNSVALINSTAIHYTGTDSYITYYPIIIDFEFSKNSGIDCSSLTFDTLINTEKSIELVKEIVRIYSLDELPYKKAKLRIAVLNLLIDLAVAHTVSVNESSYTSRTFEQIKSALKFIKEHYFDKLSLDIIAKNSLIDKYALSKKFKKLTGQTVVEYINSFRCERIKELICVGIPIHAAAIQCGFNNISFFTKTFKKYTGMLPSEYKKTLQNKQQY